MADDRLTHALPIDVARLFDSTVSQAQIGADTFQNSPDDTDLIASMIEDAEAEFHRLTNGEMKIGRAGQAGFVDSYEQPTYKVSGHKLTKGTFTGVWSDYLPQESGIMLDNQRILPFDSTAGDEVLIYQGLNDGTGTRFKDVTDDRGELWDIVNHRSGRFVFSPIAAAEYLLDQNTGALTGGVPSFLKRIRFAVTYRYGGLGGSRSEPTRTTLTTSLTDTETGLVDVADGTAFPTSGSSGSVVVLIDREYMSVDPSPSTDEMELVERGVRGTTASAHDTDDRIQYTPPGIRKCIASRAGMQLINSGRYSDWLPDTEDDMSKSDVRDNLESTWDTTIEALSG